MNNIIISQLFVLVGVQRAVKHVTTHQGLLLVGSSESCETCNNSSRTLISGEFREL